MAGRDGLGLGIAYRFNSTRANTQELTTSGQLVLNNESVKEVNEICISYTEDVSKEKIKQTYETYIRTWKKGILGITSDNGTLYYQINSISFTSKYAILKVKPLIDDEIKLLNGCQVYIHKSN